MIETPNSDKVNRIRFPYFKVVNYHLNYQQNYTASCKITNFCSFSIFVIVSMETKQTNEQWGFVLRGDKEAAYHITDQWNW